MPSGFFLKKKPPYTIFKWQHMNRKRSNAIPQLLCPGTSTDTALFLTVAEAAFGLQRIITGWRTMPIGDSRWAE
jgi:hypothetical protein